MPETVSDDGRGLLRSRAGMVMLAAIAILPYLWAIDFPLIADDYEQVTLARLYVPVSGWKALLHDPLFRCRATSLVLTYWTEKLFGFSPLAFNLSSLLLHVIAVWLVFGLCTWRKIEPAVSWTAAAFFAIYHGHQEAVTWYAAQPELLVFCFALAVLLCWIRYLRTREPWIYAAAGVFFILALASKESAVAVVPLMFLVGIASSQKWSKCLFLLAPHAIVSLGYAWLIFRSWPHHQHLNDGTFSWHTSFATVLLLSAARLFWISGLAALAVLLGIGIGLQRTPVLFGFAWIVVTLLPYSFLTYMPFVPSRHTYFASAGLALIVGAALVRLFREFFASRPALPISVACCLLLFNTGYLILKKQPQMRERAEPTEALLRFVARTKGPLYVHCFPSGPRVVELALRVKGRKRAIIWDPRLKQADAGASVFCWYHELTRKNSAGNSGPSESRVRQ